MRSWEPSYFATLTFTLRILFHEPYTIPTALNLNAWHKSLRRRRSSDGPRVPKISPELWQIFPFVLTSVSEKSDWRQWRVVRWLATYISLLGGVLAGWLALWRRPELPMPCVFAPYPRLGALIQAHSVLLRHVCIYRYSMYIYDQ